MKTYDEKLLVDDGWFLLSGTGAVSTVKHYGLNIREDTVIAVWTSKDVNGATVDLKAWYGITGATLTTSDPALVIPNEWNFGVATIQLASGSVNLLRTD